MKKNNNPEENRHPETDQRILDAYGDMTIQEGMGKEAAWKKLSDTIAKKPVKVKTLTRTFFYYAVAASFALLMTVSAGLFYFNAKTTVYTNRGETLTYHLPDNSEIVLNADTKIKFRKFGWVKKRRVLLNGEAFFSIKKGGDFTIETAEANISVIGTSFNIYSRNGNFSVKCETGSIVVAVKSFEISDTLKALQAMDILIAREQPEITRYKIDELTSATWINGEFYYDNSPLVDVFKEIERQFNVNITISKQIINRRYSGYFNKNHDLTEALTLVCAPMELKYKVDGGKNISIY